MSKKLYICRDKSCKKADPEKTLKKRAKEIVKESLIKKCKCLGICKSGYAIEYKGDVHSCPTKSDIEEVLSPKKKK